MTWFLGESSVTQGLSYVTQGLEGKHKRLKLGCPVLVPGYLYSLGPMFSASAMYMSKLLPMASVPVSKLTTAHY